MITQKESYSEYLEKMIYFQQILLDFLEDTSDSPNNFQNIITFLTNNQIQSNPGELKEFLHVISKISINHHRTNNFFDKIEQIIQNLKDSINQLCSNDEIFNIFKQNKRLLLFLFNEKIIIPNANIAKIITSNKNMLKRYPHYFYPEFKSFYNSQLANQIARSIDFNDEIFELNRKNGENEDFICQLIRDDSVDDFIYKINKANISLSSEINLSIFETNQFLFSKNPTIIEYSAFYGSINIFKYLYLNKVELNSSIWNYVIHGNNSELFHLLEEIQISPPNDSFIDCFYESVKCHHNDIAEYLKNNFLNSQFDEFVFDNSKIFATHNFAFFQNELNCDFNTIIELCKYDLFKIVNFLLLENKTFDINTFRISLNHLFFNTIQT